MIRKKRKLEVDLTPKIKKLEIITKGLVSNQVQGRYQSVFKGRGLEFESYRPYAPDDDASMIDWKATAKGGQVLVKEYREERNLNIFFLIDASDSMVFGSTQKLKSEFAAEVVSSLAFTMLEAGDKIGFATFSDKITNINAPGDGKEKFFALTRTLVDSENYGGLFEFDTAAKFLLEYLKGESLVIIVSDFVGLRENWTEHLKMAAKKFDIICIMVRDPRDRTLPDERIQVMLADPYTKEKTIVDAKLIREAYEEYVKRQEEEIGDTLRSLNVELLSISTDKPFIKPLMTFFNRRQRKWR
ncbi:DUF58 domain-containing protein [Candidatus Woesearchaeota archaeon]|nr:DUF58 domain-containing protein [Candidatus Woesearchaeota archaeon]